jgi:hypothetical protein
MTLQQIWNAFRNAHTHHATVSPFSPHPNRFDNPFLVNYVVYHHYRSLGWVIKGGIKFCVDYLLYKRGPVFHHAESVFTIYYRRKEIILTFIFLLDLQLSFVLSTKTLPIRTLHHTIYRTRVHLSGHGLALSTVSTRKCRK